MLVEQLERLLELSFQWLTASLTVTYRLYRGKLDKETGELALLTILLLVAVWIEGAKSWVMAAYRCYDLGREVRRKLTSSSSGQEQAPTQERTEALEESTFNPINDSTDSTETLQDLVTLTPQQTEEHTSSSSPQLLDSLAHLSSRALKQMARERRIKGYGRMTKAQLVAALSCC